jgi:flavin-binding protein dodecin
MSDVYRIGVAIVLHDGLGPALSMMSHKLLGVHRSVNQINSGFGRWRTALVGAAGIMGGTMMLRGMAAIATHGDKFLDQQAKLKMLGLSNQQIEEATAKAWQNAESTRESIRWAAKVRLQRATMSGLLGTIC